MLSSFRQKNSRLTTTGQTSKRIFHFLIVLWSQINGMIGAKSVFVVLLIRTNTKLNVFLHFPPMEHESSLAEISFGTFPRFLPSTCLLIFRSSSILCPLCNIVLSSFVVIYIRESSLWPNKRDWLTTIVNIFLLNKLFLISTMDVGVVGWQKGTNTHVHYVFCVCSYIWAFSFPRETNIQHFLIVPGCWCWLCFPSGRRN